MRHQHAVVIKERRHQRGAHACYTTTFISAPPAHRSMRPTNGSEATQKRPHTRPETRPENSVISGILAVKPKLRQMFSHARASRGTKTHLKRRTRLQAERRARLHLPRGNELRRRHLLAVAELRLAGVDAAALSGDHETAVLRLDHLADLPLDRAESAHQLLAAVEELQLHAVQRGPRTGRRIGRADQVVDEIHVVRPVDAGFGLAEPALVAGL